MASLTKNKKSVRMLSRLLSRFQSLLIAPKQHESPQPSLQAHTPGKSFRSSAVKPATPSKVICANYDSDDARLIGLKQEGYSDQAVANKLAAEDRAHYLPKTVASRWARLKRIVQEIEDKKLDDELSDWHVGEVHLLFPTIKTTCAHLT